MKQTVLMGLMLMALGASSAWAESAQQDRMKACNTEAAQKKLSGDARKTFMKSCLSGAAEAAKPAEMAKPAAVATGKDGKPLTAQQQRMKDCNAEAKAKDLKGDARKAFMKSCLSGKKN